jgi:hypothetical protein
MVVNPHQFGDLPVPEGHTRVYRGELAPGGKPLDGKPLPKWLASRVQNDKVINRVNGRWATGSPEYAQLFPFGETGNDVVKLVKYVDVPNHVYAQIHGLADQPDDIKGQSGNPKDEVILPEEYASKLQVSRDHSTAKGLELWDNQDTYL